MSHSILAPSSAARWRICPGSAALEAQSPELGDGAPAREGDAAHWLAAEMLQGRTYPQGVSAPNGVMIDLDMTTAAALFYRHAVNLGAPSLVAEQRVAIPRVHPECWGTPDLRAWVGDTLYVSDFKYGHGVVEAFENYQLIAYAAGALSERNGEAPPAQSEANTRVVLTIVQPRAYHPDGPVRTWETTAVKLRSYVQALHQSAAVAMEPDPPLNPQPAACENCKARPRCPALQKAAYRVMDIVQQGVPNDLPDDVLGRELSMLTDYATLLDARRTGLEEVVKHRLTAGAVVPYWKWGNGQTRTVWTRPAGEVAALGQMLGLNLMKPAEPLTPLQAQAAGMPAPLLSTFTETTRPAIKLMRDDGSDARKVFS